MVELNIKKNTHSLSQYIKNIHMCLNPKLHEYSISKHVNNILQSNPGERGNITCRRDSRSIPSPSGNRQEHWVSGTRSNILDSCSELDIARETVHVHTPHCQSCAGIPRDFSRAEERDKEQKKYAIYTGNWRKTQKRRKKEKEIERHSI